MPGLVALKAFELATGVLNTSSRVDTAEKVIPGVKVLGLESRNTARTLGLTEEEFGDAIDKPYGYTMDAIRRAQEKYEGAKVYIDHTAFEFNERGQRQVKSTDIQRTTEMVGWLQNARAVEGKGLFADLHYVSAHPYSDQLVEIAERNPSALVLSHEAVFGNPKLVGGKIYLTEIESVDKIALTSERGGTTNTLFESAAPKANTMKKTLKQIVADTKTASEHTLPPLWKELNRVVEMCDEKKKPEKGVVAELGDDEYGGLMDEMGEMPVEMDEAAGPEDQVKSGASATIHSAIDSILEGGDAAAIKGLLEYLGLSDSVSEMCAGNKTTEMAPDEEEPPVEPEEEEQMAEMYEQKLRAAQDTLLECSDILAERQVPADRQLLKAMVALESKAEREKFADRLSTHHEYVPLTRSAAPGRKDEPTTTVTEYDGSEKGSLAAECAKVPVGPRSYG